MDNQNHNLVHTLSVRADAAWHDRSYADEASCEGCRRVFARLREMDEEAGGLLAQELASHVRDGRFPTG